MWRAGKWLFLLVLMANAAGQTQLPSATGQAPGVSKPSISTSAPNQAATINLVEGDARILSAGAPVRTLRVGDIVSEGDSLVTGKDGEIHLTMRDTGFIALRPNTQLTIASYKADGGDDDKAIFRLIAGGFRSVTGWIGKFNPRAYRVQTPTATIGIRGTDHEPRYIPEGSAEGEAGTYDKVYVGTTEIENPAGKTAVAPAQAGFVPPGARQRPRILARVPGFFRPSRHEPMIEKKHAEIQKMIGQHRDERRKVVAEKRAALETARKQTKVLVEKNKEMAEETRKSEQQRIRAGQQKREAVRESGKTALELREDVQEKRKALHEGPTGQAQSREQHKALRDENKAAQEKLRDTQEKRKGLQEETKAAAEARQQVFQERKKKTQQQIEDLKGKRKDLENEREDMSKEMKALRKKEQQRYREELKAAHKGGAESSGPETGKTSP